MDGSVVYADLTFLVNFVMDFVILWATAKLAGSRIIYPRLLVAAILGGIYAIGYLLPELAGWYNIWMKIIFSGLLIIIALVPQNWIEFKKTFLYFYGINFAVAGATLASSSLFATAAGISSSYLWLLAGIFCALALAIYGEKLLTRKVIPHILRFGVELRFDRSHCNGEGFLDTGNSLRDPITNRPVVVAEYGFIKACLPKDFQQALEEKNQNEMLEALTNCSWSHRLRLIPFTSIGKKNGILVGIRADEIIVNLGQKNIFHQDLVVGIYHDRLSAEGSYQMLIPSEILQKG